MPVVRRTFCIISSDTGRPPALTLRKSPMRSLCMYGSVRGGGGHQFPSLLRPEIVTALNRIRSPTRNSRRCVLEIAAAAPCMPAAVRSRNGQK